MSLQTSSRSDKDNSCHPGTSCIRSDIIYSPSTMNDAQTTQGTRRKPSPTCWKCASPVKTSFIPRSCMTTMEAKSTKEMSGLSAYCCRICQACPRRSRPYPSVDVLVMVFRTVSPAAFADPNHRLQRVVGLVGRRDRDPHSRACRKRKGLSELQRAIFVNNVKHGRHSGSSQKKKHT